LFGLASYAVYLALKRKFEVVDLVTFIVFFGVFAPLAMLVKYRVTRFARRIPFLLAILATFLAIECAALVAFAISVWLSSAVDVLASPFAAATFNRITQRLTFDDPNLTLGLWLISLVILAMIVIAQISQKLGKGVLWNWIIGRYHRPRLENRIFMLLDLKGSTPLAESLGDLRFSELIMESFRDIGEAVEDCEGEISHYVGDEIVISWPEKIGLRDRNCLRCFYLSLDKISSRQAFYKNCFQTVPKFRAAIHGGSVVVTQVGYIKSEIVFHGDVLNTAARMEQLAKELGVDLLISQTVLSRLDGINETPKPLGTHRFKGKEQEVEVYTLST